MPDTYTPIEQVEWRQIGVINNGPHDHRWHLTLPRPLADWDVFDYWERERLEHMAINLHPGTVLFDIGAEHGWLSLIYASMVGPHAMALIEPTREMWPNIYHTWRRANYPDPLLCYQGLLSDHTDDERPVADGWPERIDGPLIGNIKYEYIHQHDEAIRQMTLDDLVGRSGVVPDALTIDVEGAELNVLLGAEHTLDAHHPQIWVSIHPDLMERDYQSTPQDVYDYLESFGYIGTYLATDHEEHHYFAAERN